MRYILETSEGVRADITSYHELWGPILVGHSGAVKLMIEYGAQVCEDELRCALSSRCKEIALCLLDLPSEQLPRPYGLAHRHYGYPGNARHSPLEMAVRWGERTVIKKMLHNGYTVSDWASLLRDYIDGMSVNKKVLKSLLRKHEEAQGQCSRFIVFLYLLFPSSSIFIFVSLCTVFSFLFLFVFAPFSP